MQHAHLDWFTITVSFHLPPPSLLIASGSLGPVLCVINLCNFYGYSSLLSFLYLLRNPIQIIFLEQFSVLSYLSMVVFIAYFTPTRCDILYWPWMYILNIRQSLLCLMYNRKLPFVCNVLLLAKQMTDIHSLNSVNFFLFDKIRDYWKIQTDTIWWPAWVSIHCSYFLSAFFFCWA